MTKREKKEILRTCDRYFDQDTAGNYAVDKDRFMALVHAMLENEDVADNLEVRKSGKAFRNDHHKHSN